MMGGQNEMIIMTGVFVCLLLFSQIFANPRWSLNTGVQAQPFSQCRRHARFPGSTPTHLSFPALPPPLPLRKPHTSATPPLSLPFLLLPLLQLGHPSCDNCCTWTGGQPWLPYVTHTALPLKRQGLHCDPRGVEGNQEDLWLPFAPDASAPN